MPPPLEQTCPHCGAKFALSGPQMFVLRKCPACDASFRAHDEIGGYRLLEPLARSGLGILFRALDSTGGTIAVKLLRPPFAATAADPRQCMAALRKLSALHHPHVQRIFAVGFERGVLWIAMEWLPHGSLASRLAARGRLPEIEVLTLGLQAAAALSAAHAAGLPHRDLEPNNLVFAADGGVKVTDFAQAALYQCAADELGTMWGRPCYVSPERLRNEPEEAPSDIYSLGAILFHALTGTPLHGGDPHGQIMLDLVESEAVFGATRIAGVQRETLHAIELMLASETTERAQDWGEVITLLTKAATVARGGALPEPPAPAESSGRSRGSRSPRRTALVWAWIGSVLLALAVTSGALARKRWSGTQNERDFRARHLPAISSGHLSR